MTVDEYRQMLVVLSRLCNGVPEPPPWCYTPTPIPQEYKELFPVIETVDKEAGFATGICTLSKGHEGPMHIECNAINGKVQAFWVDDAESGDKT